MPTENPVIVVLVLLGILLVVLIVIMSRRPPQQQPAPVEPPKTPPAPEPPRLTGLDVWTPHMAPWFDPTRWPPLSFPAGSVICVTPTYTVGTQTSVRPTRFEFQVFAMRAGGWGIIERGTLFPDEQPFRWTWCGGSFVSGGCGDMTPDPYRLVCVMHATDGSVQQVEVTLYAVSQRASR